MAKIVKMKKGDHVIEVVESAFKKVWSKMGWEEADADAELTDLVLDVDNTEDSADAEGTPTEVAAAGGTPLVGTTVVDPGSPSGQSAPSGVGLPPAGNSGQSKPAGS